MGVVGEASLSAPFVAPGCRYDVIRGKRGNIGAALPIDLFDANASSNGAAQVTSDGVHHDAVAQVRFS